MTVWLQISSGRGPDECSWVVARCLERITRECARATLNVKLLEAVSNGNKGLHSALLCIEGGEPGSFVRSWEGSILWRGQSPFRPHHKRKNWFVSVAAFSVPEKLDIRMSDIRFETMTSGGPGGQHVNRTESAVRAIHVPTGLAVKSSEERSQKMNRELALARLCSLLRQGNSALERSAQEARWMQHNELVRGNPIRTFVGDEFELQKPL